MAAAQLRQIFSFSLQLGFDECKYDDAAVAIIFPLLQVQSSLHQDTFRLSVQGSLGTHGIASNVCCTSLRCRNNVPAFDTSQ